jgi:hypothetical protein
MSLVRTRGVAGAAFAMLRTPLGRAAAGRILFGDGSFPDPVGPDLTAAVPALRH